MLNAQSSMSMSSIINSTSKIDNRQSVENQVIHLEDVISVIYLIRNEKVILDRDLARLYGVPTKALKQAVKRNIDRFPVDFMFELSLEEYNALRSQIVTLKSPIPQT